MPCRKRTGRQTRLLTLLKRKVGALGTKEGDCLGMHSRNLQIARCSVALRISWVRSLCLPKGQSSSAQPWVLFGGTISTSTRLQAPLLVCGCCCLSLRPCRAPIPDQRCSLIRISGKSVVCLRSPMQAAHCLAVATVAPRIEGQPCRNPVLCSLLCCVWSSR